MIGIRSFRIKHIIAILFLIVDHVLVLLVVLLLGLALAAAAVDAVAGLAEALLAALAQSADILPQHRVQLHLEHIHSVLVELFKQSC